MLAVALLNVLTLLSQRDLHIRMRRTKKAWWTYLKTMYRLVGYWLWGMHVHGVSIGGNTPFVAMFFLFPCINFPRTVQICMHKNYTSAFVSSIHKHLYAHICIRVHDIVEYIYTFTFICIFDYVHDHLPPPASLPVAVLCIGSRCEQHVDFYSL